MLEQTQTAAAAAKGNEQVKDLLTTQEAAKYMGISKSYLYKLTMQKRIPYYKPFGKIAYFRRSELESVAFHCRIATNEELEQQAQTYCANRKGGKR